MSVFLALIFILFAALCWFYANKVFFLLPFLAPFYFFKFIFFGAVISPVEIFLIIFLIIFFWKERDFFNDKALNLLKSIFSGDKIKNNYFWPTIFILLGGFLSTIFSDNFLSSLHAYFAWFVEPILIFVVGIKILSKIENRKIFLRFLFLSYTLIMLMSLVYLFLGIKDNGRLSGFYNSPNFLAMVLEIFLVPLAAFLFLHKDYFWKNALIFLTLILSIILLAHTQSFGALFAVLVSILWILFFTYPRSNKILFYSFAVLLGLVLIFFFITAFNLGKIDRLFSGDPQSSFNSRLPIWKTSWYILKDNLILGIGPNSFLNNFHLKQQELGLSLDFLVVPQPHNIFFAFWLESGILGLVGFLWIIKNVFFDLIKKIRLKKSYQWLLVGIGGSFLAILIHGLVDVSYFKFDLAYYFWIILLWVNVL